MTTLQNISHGKAISQQPGHVLEQFDKRRKQVLHVLQQAQQFAESLGGIQEHIHLLLQTANAAVDQKRLNLVVIGAEGHGKSTLINSITGQELTPQSEQHPGTVAPLFLEFSPHEKPVFAIKLDGKDDLKVCRTLEEFCDYVLQKSNRDNHKKVLWGRVSCNHPILAQGLRLVDMPGVEGVSPAIAVEAQQFIKEQAHAVVAVLRDRGYGPLTRVVDNLSTDSLRVHALISNWSLDYWIGKSEDEVADFIENQSNLVPDYIKQEGSEIDISSDKIFVLHLPSFCQLQRSQPPQVASLAHQREAEEFIATFWGYVQANGVDEVILDATGTAERLLGEIDAFLAIRQDFLTALIEGDERTGANLLASFERAKVNALSEWAKVYQLSVSEAIATAAWQGFHNRPDFEVVLRTIAQQEGQPLKTALDNFRDRILGKINEIHNQVEVQEGKVRKQEAQTIRANLERFIADQQTRLNDNQEKILIDILTYYCGHANQTLRIFFEELPVLRQTVLADGAFTPESLIAFEIGKMEPGIMTQLLNASLIGGASAVAGNLAGGTGTAVLVTLLGMTPPGALIAGAIGGGVLAFGLINLLLDQHRPAVLKELQKFKSAIQAIDTSDSSNLCMTWSKTVTELSESVHEFLLARFDHIQHILINPDISYEQLSEQLNQITASRQEIERLGELLTIIGTAK